MWDTRVLEYLNERAHQQAVERAAERAERLVAATADDGQEIKANVQPTIFPLSILAGRLVVGPPLISHLVDIFSNGDIVSQFNDLVREYLPEHEATIRAEPFSRRVVSFTRFFSQSFFPLMDEFNSPDASMAELLEVIPVDYMGFTYNDFHDFNDFRPGYILLLSLAECSLDEYDEDEEGSHGGRVPIIERMRELVGVQLAQLLPAAGWDAKYLHEVTDGTKFDGCGDFADWVVSSTDYWLLNCTQAEYEQQETPGEEWDMATVRTLADEWPLVCHFWEKLNILAGMLEGDMENNFRELVTMLVDDKEKIIPKEQLQLPLGENE